MKITERICDHIVGDILGIRIKPKTIQLPITGYCNSRCTTCNVWKSNNRVHIDAEMLKEKLKDPFFSRVKTIGINGGEPSLHPSFEAVIESVLTLPNIKDIYVISNGMKKDILLPKLENAKKMCRNKGVLLHVTVSLDGIGTINDTTRGITGGYKMTLETIKHITEKRVKYCDSIDVGYTISKRNYTDMVAVKAIMSKYNILPYYHIAVPNKRIHTFESADYSVLNDKKAQMLAREFFYGEYVNSSVFVERIKSFINYYYLSQDRPKRIALCTYLHRDITIDEHLNVYLCATASNKIGSLLDITMTEISRSKCIKMEEKCIKEYCAECAHYANAPSIRGYVEFIIENISKINLVLDLICSRLHI